MNKNSLLVLGLFLGLVTCPGWGAESFQLSSPSFQSNTPIPSEYTCEGRNINPPLEINGIPKQAVSLALLMTDPDAPFGSRDHWILWNIPSTTKTLTVGHIPLNAVSGKNSFKKYGYSGPCPPFGTHRYHFTLYALDTLLDLPKDTTKKRFLKATKSHILAETTMQGIYHKQH